MYFIGVVVDKIYHRICRLMPTIITFTPHLHADVPGEHGGDGPQDERSGGEGALDPRGLADAHKEEDHGTEDHDEDAADGVLRGQEGVRAVADRFVDLKKTRRGGESGVATILRKSML